MKKQLLSALCLLAFGISLQAATVIGDMTLLFGDGATNGEFSVSGLDLPMSYNGITYLAEPVSGQLTNGQLNVTLTPPGRYDISFPALNTSLRIINPANTNTYDISQLVTNIAVFVSQGISRQVLPGDGVAFVTNNLGQINETITIAAVGGVATNSYQSVAGNDLVAIITDPTSFTQTIFGVSQTNNQLVAWAQLAPESKQDHSSKLDLWSAVDPSSFQPFLGYTPATTNFATTDVPGLILPDGTTLVIDPTTHKLSSVATGTGDFVGPNAATSGHVVTFGSDSGKLGQDSGHALSEYTLLSQIASGSQNGVLSSNDWATFNGKQAYSTNLDLWSAVDPSSFQPFLGYTPATTNFATTEVPGLILPDGTTLVIDPTTHKLSSVATGTGDFVGPNAATSGHVVTFGSDSGKLGQDSGHALSEYTLLSQIASGSQNGVLSSNDWATFNGKQAYSTNLDLWSAVDPSSFQPFLGYTPATTNFATTEVPGLILPDGTTLVIDPTTHKLSSVATGTGDFVGPNAATSGHVVTFGSDSGKLGQDSGHALSEYTLLSQIASGSQNGVLSSNDWATFNGKQAYSTNLDLWSAVDPSSFQPFLGYTPATTNFATTEVPGLILPDGTTLVIDPTTHKLSSVATGTGDFVGPNAATSGHVVTFGSDSGKLGQDSGHALSEYTLLSQIASGSQNGVLSSNDWATFNGKQAYSTNLDLWSAVDPSSFQPFLGYTPATTNFATTDVPGLILPDGTTLVIDPTTHKLSSVATGTGDFVGPNAATSGHVVTFGSDSGKLGQDSGHALSEYTLLSQIASGSQNGVLSSNDWATFNGKQAYSTNLDLWSAVDPSSFQPFLGYTPATTNFATTDVPGLILPDGTTLVIDPTTHKLSSVATGTGDFVGPNAATSGHVVTFGSDSGKLGQDSGHALSEYTLLSQIASGSQNGVLSSNDWATFNGKQAYSTNLDLWSAVDPSSFQPFLGYTPATTNFATTEVPGLILPDGTTLVIDPTTHKLSSVATGTGDFVGPNAATSGHVVTFGSDSGKLGQDSGHALSEYTLLSQIASGSQNGVLSSNDWATFNGKQAYSTNLDLWSAVDPSSFQPFLGYTPATTNFATTEVPGLILPDGTTLVIDPTTHKLSSVATGTGDFVGPNAATSGHVVTFGSDSGKLGQDSGHALSEYTLLSQIASGSQNGVLSSNDWATFNGKQAYSTNLDLWSAVDPSSFQPFLGYTPATTNFATTDVPGLILPDGTTLVIDPTTHKLSSVATGTGDFVGPNAATSGHVVTFGSDSGKLGQDSGHALSEYTLLSQIASGSQNGVLSSNDWATFNGKQAYSTNLDLWSAVDPSSFQPFLGYTPATTNFATTEVPGLILPDGTTLVIDPTTHKLSSVATGTGDFVGPNAATSGHVVTFGSDSGKLGQDSGHALSEYTLLSQIASGSQNGVLSSNDWATFNGKQAYSTNLDLWSAVDPSSFQPFLGYTPATTNFATTEVPGLILPDGTTLVIDPTTHKLSSVATGTGDFVGPNAATSGHVVTFGSDSGKLGQDSGHALSEYTLLSQIASGSQNGVLSSNDWATFNGKQAYSTNLDLWSAVDPSSFQPFLGYTPATTNFATTDVPGLILPDGTTLVIDPTTHKLSSVATGTGDFVGPNAATSGHVVTFGSDSGKLGQDSGHALSEYTLLSQIASGSQNGVLSSNDWATFNGKQAYSTNLDLWSAVDPSSFQPFLGYTPATTNFATTEVPGLILPDGTTLVIDPTTHKLSSVATGTGDFVGPNAATSGHVVTFGSDSGKLGQDSGHALSEYTLLSQIASGSQNGVLSSNDWATFNGKQAYSTNLDLWSAVDPSSFQPFLGYTPATTNFATTEVPGLILPDGTTLVIDPTTHKLSSVATGTGDFVGPNAATSGHVVTFGSDSGKLGQDSGHALSEYTLLSQIASGSQNGVLSSNDWATFNGKQAYSTNLDSWSALEPSAKQDALGFAPAAATPAGIANALGYVPASFAQVTQAVLSITLPIDSLAVPGQITGLGVDQNTNQVTLLFRNNLTLTGTGTNNFYWVDAATGGGGSTNLATSTRPGLVKLGSPTVGIAPDGTLWATNTAGGNANNTALLRTNIYVRDTNALILDAAKAQTFNVGFIANGSTLLLSNFNAIANLGCHDIQINLHNGTNGGPGLLTLMNVMGNLTTNGAWTQTTNANATDILVARVDGTYTNVIITAQANCSTYVDTTPYLSSGGGDGGPAPTNTPPTISTIPALSVTSGQATVAIPFTIGDAETPATSLTVSGSSSSTTLVPNANIVFGGSGANRTVTVTPAAGNTGTAQITVTVSDGTNTASSPFTLTVTPAPTNTGGTGGTGSGFVRKQFKHAYTVNGRTQSATFDSNTAAGSAIIAVTSGYSTPDGGSVTDTQGNSYTLLRRIVGSSGSQLSVYVALSTAGGADTVTVATSGETDSSMTIFEYSGVTAVDVSGAST